MGRILVAAVLAGLVYYIWGMLSWMVTPIHTSSFREFPEEVEIASELKVQDLESGLYVYPARPDMSKASEEEQAVYTKRHNNGPLFTVFYTAEGGPEMPPSTMLSGLLIDIVGALIAAFLLALAAPSCPSYWGRVGFVLLIGLFAAVVVHIAYWNWMNFPLDHTIAMSIDVIVGWFLAALVLAWLIRPIGGERAGVSQVSM